MTKQVLGVFAALAMVSGPLFGMMACSSPDPGVTATDTGVKPDSTSTSDSTSDSKPMGDAPKPVPDGESGAPTDKTTGKPCMTNDECDVTGNGVNFCAKGGFTSGSLYPTPVCIGNECDPGDGTTIQGCDGDTGVCLSTGMGGICLPVCDFADSAAAPKGCEGKNVCNVYGWGKDPMTMAISGVGYCFGGCTADADCPSGEKCQVGDGLCLKATSTYTKTPGTACTDVDAKAPAKCNCLYTTKEKMGYCANVCRVGSATCGTGFSCDSGLPKTKIRDTDTVFTAVPAGIAGNCLKNCTTDADCAGLNAYCDENAGMAGQKTCQVGKRRCATNANCPTGQTCTGATAMELGTCG